MTTPTNQDTASVMTLEEMIGFLRDRVLCYGSEETPFRSVVESAVHHLEAGKRDAARLDWLDKNLVSMSHVRATCSVHMCGTTIHGQVLNDRSQGGGTFKKLKGRSIRHAIDMITNPKLEEEA